MNLPPVILASNSPRRKELLAELKVDFKVVPSDAEEAHTEELTAMEISQLNAYRKARVVAKKFPDALVLGADTLVYLETQLLGKPKDADQAFEMLKQLQGKTHQVATGICLLHLRGHRQKICVETTEVTFRKLSDAKIRDYLALINPLDKAGGYAIQEHGDRIVENITGSFSNVIGLPMERLKSELAQWPAAV